MSNCPTCGKNGIYVGFVTVECNNKNCIHFYDDKNFYIKLYKRNLFGQIVEANFLGYTKEIINLEDPEHVYSWKHDGKITQTISQYALFTSTDDLIRQGPLSAEFTLTPGNFIRLILGEEILKSVFEFRNKKENNK